MLMKTTIRNINVNYIQYGSGSDVVLLHGWGQNIEMMKPIGDRLQKLVDKYNSRQDEKVYAEQILDNVKIVNHLDFTQEELDAIDKILS